MATKVVTVRHGDATGGRDEKIAEMLTDGWQLLTSVTSVRHGITSAIYDTYVREL